MIDYVITACTQAGEGDAGIFVELHDMVQTCAKLKEKQWLCYAAMFYFSNLISLDPWMEHFISYIL